MHLLDSHLQLTEAFSHDIAEVKQHERPLKLFLHYLPQLRRMGKANKVAGQAHDLTNAVVRISKPRQTTTHCLDGRGTAEGEETIVCRLCSCYCTPISLVSQADRSQMARHAWNGRCCAILLLHGAGR